MHPILFRIGDFPIGTYGVMIVIGLIGAILIGSWLARKINLRADYIYDLTFVMLIAGFLGARLLFIIVEWEQFLETPMALLLSRQGFVFYGGLIAAPIAGVAYCRWHKLPIFEIADRIHVARLGKRGAVLNPKKISMSDTVAVMTGALRPEDLPADALA